MRSEVKKKTNCFQRGKTDANESQLVGRGKGVEFEHNNKAKGIKSTGVWDYFLKSKMFLKLNFIASFSKKEEKETNCIGS